MQEYDLFAWLEIENLTPPSLTANKQQEIRKLESIASVTQSKPMQTAIAKPNTSMAAKLRALADSMEAEVQNKLNPACGRQRITKRRSDMAAGMRDDGRKLQLVQKWLNQLADCWDDGTIAPVLQKISSKKVLHLFASMNKTAWLYSSQYSYKDFDEKDVASIWQDNQYYVDWQKSLKSAGINNATDTWLALCTLKSLGVKLVDTDKMKIENIQRSLIGRKIDGYFPTPSKVCSRVIELAKIQPGMSVLEPSAGSGHLASAVPASAKLDVIEIHSDLRKILELKKFNVIERNFMSFSGQYDRIVMNPPFENFQDIDHVRHAYDCLAPGGRLVSVTSAAWTFRQDRKAAEFRTWLQGLGATSEECDDGAFQASDRPTGVKTWLVVIEK